MPTFKQKNVIRTYKLRLQDKLRAVTEETENATSLLNNCVEEFRSRVQHILEIKDEKCLSLYRKLIKDLENYSEKLFILQTSLEENSDEESDSSEDECAANIQKDQSKPPSSLTQNESLSKDLPYPDGNLNTNKHAEQNLNQQRHPEENLRVHSEKNASLSDSLERSINAEKNLDLQKYSDKNVHLPRYFDENVRYNFHDGDEDDGGSITEDDFYSLHSDNNVQNINNNTLLNSQSHGCGNETISASDYASNISVSQSSCYRSISSSIGESLSFYTENKNVYSLKTSLSKNECSLETSESPLVILPIEFEISSSFSATLSYIIDPSDFWIEIENSYGSKLRFPKSEYDHFSNLSSIRQGQYCLAPFKSTPFYYRAKSFSDAKSGKELVKVLFIDHGSVQVISVCDLRHLPISAYEIPAQAIHCYLHGIAPTDDSWSDESIEKFKSFQNFCIETVVKAREHLYGVQLITKLSAIFSDDFSVDIAQALCLDKLAISLNEPLSDSVNQKELCTSHLSKPVCSKGDSSLEVSGSYDINAISSDSGVSVNSAYKSQISSKRNEIFTKVSSDYVSSVTIRNTISPYNKNLIEFNHDSKIKDLISFESYDALNECQSSNERMKQSNSSSFCLSCRNKKFCLHLKIPSPSMLFVEKDMAIVMLSHIINPHEFYVNMAMENIITLDDLREQMTNTYDKSCYNVKIEDLSENMFCAGRFDADDYWYRVKILNITQENKEKNEVFGQYVDYGNTATIKCCNLRPLTVEFSKHPCFAIKCSLAGVTPIKDFTLDGASDWHEDTINVFKKLTSFERCLTAQICNESHADQNNSYSVLLWDTDNSNDLLINKSMADHKVAMFDHSLLCPPSHDEKVVKSNIDSWDPMLEEYIDSHNSYAIDDEDIEIATTGYQAKDEEYTCKYFALRGYCPRGPNCRFEHVPLLESGITRDQEEVYCLDNVPIISESVNNTLVQVSAIISPTQFYVVLPFGCKIVDDIDDLVSKGSSYNEIINSEAKALFYQIDKYYSKLPFQENTCVALSCGTIVVARRKWDEKWHRGRIVDVVGINRPAEVFFVDSGDIEWVPRKFIRTIAPQFLHTPFQAVHCSLHGIEPAGSEKGSSWSSEALNYFKDLVAGEILLAEIVHRFGQIFHLTLRKTSRGHHKNVAECLVSARFAQYHEVVQKKSVKKGPVYVPG